MVDMWKGELGESGWGGDGEGGLGCLDQGCIFEMLSSPEVDESNSYWGERVEGERWVFIF